MSGQLLFHTYCMISKFQSIVNCFGGLKVEACSKVNGLSATQTITDSIIKGFASSTNEASQFKIYDLDVEEPVSIP
ncbi:predicted protein [Botrytis cinerea T4]|uniref:Uncharacterized protein n=1 Tax=Botryotinia fuckeliana (strain T4) TaxID=999810 RepID=G2Y4U3_BOTF4|nr:predicted protein [Botrytis cinerea T4]